jgi:hypothetical protein
MMKSKILLLIVLVAVISLVIACGSTSTQQRPLTEEDIKGIAFNTRDAVFDASLSIGPDGQHSVSALWAHMPNADVRYVRYGDEAIGWILAFRDFNIVEVTVHIERDREGYNGWKYTDWAWVSESASGKFEDQYPSITSPNHNHAILWVQLISDVADDVLAFAEEQEIDFAEFAGMDLEAVKLKEIALIKLENEQRSYVLKYQYENDEWNRVGFKEME